jgi:hypothetical protein
MIYCGDMSAELEATAETTITVKFSGEYAARIMASLGRILTSVDHMDPERRVQLVNTHTVDDLLALKTALLNATESAVVPEQRRPPAQHGSSRPSEWPAR